MKQILLVALLASFSIGAPGLMPAQTATFIQEIDVATDGSLRDMIQMPNGDYVMAGNLNPYRDGFLARWDSIGQLVWAGLLPDHILVDRLANGPGDGFYACGRIDSSGQDSALSMVGYFSGTGVNQWWKVVDDGETHTKVYGKAFGNGNLLLGAGANWSGSHDYVAVLDTLANIVWQDRFPPSTKLVIGTCGPSCALVSRYNWMTGVTELSKLGPSGNVLWSVEMAIEPEEIVTYQDSIIYIGGLVPSYPDDPVLVKLDSAGQTLFVSDLTEYFGIRHFRFKDSGEMLVSGELLVDPHFQFHWQASYGRYDPVTESFLTYGLPILLGYGMSPLFETRSGDIVLAYTDERSTSNTIRLERRDAQFFIGCDTIPVITRSHYLRSETSTPTSVAVTAPNPPRNLAPIVLTAFAPVVQVICAPNLVNATPPELGVQAFPNPVTDVLQLTKPGSDGGFRKVLLINALGQVMFQSGHSSHEMEINMRQLPAGCYRLVWQTESEAWGSTNVTKVGK